MNIFAILFQLRANSCGGRQLQSEIAEFTPATDITIILTFYRQYSDICHEVIARQYAGHRDADAAADDSHATPSIAATDLVSRFHARPSQSQSQ